MLSCVLAVKWQWCVGLMILHDTQSDNVEAALIIFVAMLPSFLLKIIIFSAVIGKRNCSIVRRCIGEQIK